MTDLQSLPEKELWKIQDKEERHASFAARDTGRAPATALYLWQNPNATGYIFVPENSEFGLEEWQLVSGVDALRDLSKVILEIGSVGEKIVDPDYTIYVSNKHCN